MMARRDLVSLQGRLQWLIDFSLYDLASMKEKELEALSEDIHEFARTNPISRQTLGKWRPLSRKVIGEIQNQWREGLDRIKPTTLSQLSVGKRLQRNEKRAGRGSSDLEEWWIEKDILNSWELPIQKIDVRVVLYRGRDGYGRYRIGRDIYLPDFRSAFWLAVLDTLVAAGSRLRSCPECRTLVLYRKKKTYCSKKCAQRLRQRRWYARHKEAAKKQRRTLYKERRQKEIGHPNLKIGKETRGKLRTL